MRCKDMPAAATIAVAIFGVIFSLIGAVTPLAAQQETVLATFNFNSPGGDLPFGGLARDSAGNLYGTTTMGGKGSCFSKLGTGCGTVYELSPKAGGGWTKKVLHVFQNDGHDGTYPQAGLTLDADGNLYGTTTALGGTGCRASTPIACGTVFELMHTSSGWVEKILHVFGPGHDGPFPGGGVVLDAAGNLYGVTTGIIGSCTASPSTNCGAVYELTPRPSGPWKEKVLHYFRYNGVDGYSPRGNLAVDAEGNLYGGTYGGGVYFDGIAFKLTHNTSEGWVERVLHAFYLGRGTNYGGPAGLTLDAEGTLYGATDGGRTSNGSPGGDGFVFRLQPTSGGAWTMDLLYNFGGFDGMTPNSGLVLDSAGNLYGTTRFGGTGAITCLTTVNGTIYSCGTVFELSPAASGLWTETVLHNFGNGLDGQQPTAGVVLDEAGNLYGTTYNGGSAGSGIVFEVTP